VSNRIAYHLDEHIPNAIAKGLRRHGINVTTPMDATLLGVADHTHLEYARSTSRVMVTYDSDYLRLHKL
jgi:hypothetical protein